MKTITLRHLTSVVTGAEHADVTPIDAPAGEYVPKAVADQLLAALERCDMSMDTASIIGLPQELPAMYRASWAESHQMARAAMEAAR